MELLIFTIAFLVIGFAIGRLLNPPWWGKSIMLFALAIYFGIHATYRAETVQVQILGIILAVICAGVGVGWLIRGDRSTR